MRLFNWAKRFEQTPTCDDILRKVRRTEIMYWIYLLISIGIAIWGIDMMLDASENSLKLHCVGLFLALAGVINVAVIKLWAHIRLTMYFTMWDSKNCIDSEMRRLEAQDL